MHGLVLNPHTGRPEHEDGSRFDLESVLVERRMFGVLDELRQAKEKPGFRAYSRNKHYVSLRTVATAATARAPAAILWNPSASARIFLFEVWVFPTTAASINLGLARATARGTASTSLAMVLANSIENDVAAPSGAVVDSAWSVAATISAANLGQLVTPAAIGNGVILPFPDPISIPPGTGLALITTQAVAFAVSDCTFCYGD